MTTHLEASLKRKVEDAPIIYGDFRSINLSPFEYELLCKKLGIVKK